MEVYYCNADTLHEQVNVTLPKNNMELHAIPEVPQYEPMVRSQLDFVPQEIMQLTFLVKSLQN